MDEKNQPTPNPRVNSTSSTVQYTHTFCNKEVSGFDFFNLREREVLPTQSESVNTISPLKGWSRIQPISTHIRTFKESRLEPLYTLSSNWIT